MDALTLLLAGISIVAAVLAYGGVTQPEWGFCMALLGLAATLYWGFTSKYKRAPADRPLFLLTLALVVWTAVQARWLSVAPARSFEYIFTNAALGLSLLLARELGWRFRRNLWIAAVPVLLAATVEGALALSQFFAMREGVEAAGSASGTYPNRNHFAGLLEMVLPLAVAAAAAFWRGPNKRWWGAAGMSAVAGLLLLGTVISLSRMGFLAALGGLFVLGVLLLGGRRRLAAAAFVGTLLLLAFLILPTGEWIARFADIAQTEEISAGSRAQIWRDTLPLIRDFWLTGTGMGGYQTAFYRYKDVAPMSTVDYVHNDYLQYFAELGLFGFSLGLAILGRCFYWMGRGLSGSLFTAGAWGAVAAMAAHSLVDFNLYIPANAMVLAWIIGLAASTAMTESRRATTSE